MDEGTYQAVKILVYKKIENDHGAGVKTSFADIANLQTKCYRQLQGKVAKLFPQANVVETTETFYKMLFVWARENHHYPAHTCLKIIEMISEFDHHSQQREAKIFERVIKS